MLSNDTPTEQIQPEFTELEAYTTDADPSDPVAALDALIDAWSTFSVEPTNAKWERVQTAYYGLRAMLTPDEMRGVWRSTHPDFLFLREFDAERNRRYHQTSDYVEWRKEYETKRNANEERQLKLREYQRTYRKRQRLVVKKEAAANV